MTIGASLFFIAVGAILNYAVTADVAGVDLQTVGVILMVIGAIGMVFGVIQFIIANRSGAPPAGPGGPPVGGPPPGGSY